MLQENFKYIRKDCVLVNRNYWEENSSQLVQTYTRRLNIKVNYITKVVKANYDREKFKYHDLKEQDLIFVSRYITTFKNMPLGSSADDYTNVPMSSILGCFRNNNISFSSLDILDDKVLVEKIDDLQSNGIVLTQAKECTVGKVVKVGKGGFFSNWTRKSKPSVNVGDIILFWNNISTPIDIDGKTYLCFEDNRVIGKFTNGDISLSSLELLDGRILLIEQEDVKEDLDGVIIIAKDEDQDFTSIPTNRFKVVKIASVGREVRNNVYIPFDGMEEGDIVVVDRNVLDYVDFKGVTYKTIEDIYKIQAILK